MDLSPGQVVVTMHERVIDVGLRFPHVPANTPGVVLEVEGSWPQRALVRFTIDGEDLKDWIDSDELVPG
jgi:hypothetical protein